MAQLNYINIAGHSRIGVNLTDIVGPGAPNKPDDVALIQALLRYIGKALGKDAMGVLDAWPLPKTTGRWDTTTEIYVRGYKAEYANRLLNGLNPDQRIHPAAYKGRVVRNPMRPLMMITHMHLYALVAASESGHNDYVKEIVSMMPLFMRVGLFRPHWSDA